ncbi:hypothetical protein [Nonomuraea typhae]|uniref:hypothetical protein n=1 Tax=Nonomuraea typhae TaxID=2603600 RepID=UPI0012F87EB8|nr:hypothetical protein [Nonomuraea typhae]
MQSWWFGSFPDGLRDPDGGDLAPAARARRELLAAAGLPAASRLPPEVAGRLRVWRKPVYAWHKIRRTAGGDAKVSRGLGGQPGRQNAARAAHPGLRRRYV